MQKERFKEFKGAKSYYSHEAYEYRKCIERLTEISRGYGFQELIIPTLQHSLIFGGLGNTSDIVNKEMFFLDGTEYVLRPEMTLPTANAILSKKLHCVDRPLRIYTIGNCFRRERPQLGRLREFTQFSVDIVGSKSKFDEGELLSLLQRTLDSVIDIELSINYLGCTSCRTAYSRALKEYVISYMSLKSIDDEVIHRRLQSNPLRILDDKRPILQEALESSPKLNSYLCNNCRCEYDKSRKNLTRFGVNFSTDDRLVRGLDYYTGLVFEFKSSSIGSQSAVCAGGRYDNLYSDLSDGGVDLPSIGASIGVERLMLATANYRKGEVFGLVNRPTVLIDSSGEESNAENIREILNAFRSKKHPIYLDTRNLSLKKLLISHIKKGTEQLVIFFSCEKVVFKFLYTKKELILSCDELIKAIATLNASAKLDFENLTDKFK